MKQYFWLQCKRLVRYLPGAFLATLVLLGGLAGVLGGLMGRQDQKEENNKYRVGLVGSMEDPLLQIGVEALRQYDSSQLAMELVPLAESQAKKQLSTGQISAYVVVPEGFMQEAMKGNILPLKFVSTVGASGLNSLFQQEITRAISQLLTDAQKGVYGMYAVTVQQGVYQNQDMDNMAIRYAEYILQRDRVYQVEILGAGAGTDLESYLLGGFLVLLMLLTCLPFAPVLIRRDVSLGQMLAARGRPAFWQAVCDFAGYALAMVVMVLAAALVGICVPGLERFGELLLRAIPVAILCAAISYCVYTATADLIGGVLLQFFGSVALCFVSGCLYPVYFFPVGLQKIAAWLPTGAARDWLCGNGGLWLTLGYALVFFLAGSYLSCRKLRGVGK